MFDVIIVGGGPAGLSAALVLGRCRRRVLLCDNGQPRNAASRALHGYLTRDGIPPLELLRLAREELRAYGIEPREATVEDVCRREDDGPFEVILDGGERVEALSVLLATGVRDVLPEIAGIDECYGISVHHCPYCDGWEVRDKRIAVLGQGAAAAGLALSLKTWTDHVVVCTNGLSRLGTTQRRQLAERQIEIVTGALARLDHADGWVRRLVLADGGDVPCDAVFFTGEQLQSELPGRLGCELTRKGVARTDHLGQTRVPGLYVVGDASHDVQFAIVAAAEGAKAGVAINKALQARAGLVVRKAGPPEGSERQEQPAGQDR